MTFSENEQVPPNITKQNKINIKSCNKLSSSLYKDMANPNMPIKLKKTVNIIRILWVTCCKYNVFNNFVKKEIDVNDQEIKPIKFAALKESDKFLAEQIITTFMKLLNVPNIKKQIQPMTYSDNPQQFEFDLYIDDVNDNTEVALGDSSNRTLLLFFASKRFTEYGNDKRDCLVLALYPMLDSSVSCADRVVLEGEVRVP